MTDEELREALEALGSTPDEVAQTLRAAGAVGKRGSTFRCPVASFLRRIDPNITVGITDAGGKRGQIVPMPQAVRLFIRMFDLKGYPDLEPL